MSGAGGPALGLAALGGALLAWVPPDAGRRARVRALVPAPAAPERPPTPAPSRRRRWLQAGVAGLAVLALLGGGLTGMLLGAGTAVGVERLLRHGPTDATDLGAAIRRDLPVVCDLIAVCLQAGTPVGAAVTAVSASVPGPLGEQLAEVGALYRLGAAPRQAWSGTPPGMGALARTLVRAGESGSSIVPALQRLATDVRTDQRAAVETAVRRAGVWILAPLGVCFLPAFLCLGVVPLVLGIAADVFG